MITTEQKIYAERVEVNKGLVELCMSLQPTHWLTFAYNREMSVERGRSLLKKFHVKVEQRILGKKYDSYHRKFRINSISFVEHLDGNFHYHSFFHVPKRQLAKFSFYSNSSGRLLWELSRKPTDPEPDFFRQEKAPLEGGAFCVASWFNLGRPGVGYELASSSLVAPL